MTPPAEPSPPPLVEELAESVRLALRLPYKGEIVHALSQCPRFVRAAKLLAAVERPEPTPLLNRITSICGRHRMSPTGAADALDDLRRDPMVADAAERLARLERERAALLAAWLAEQTRARGGCLPPVNPADPRA